MRELILLAGVVCLASTMHHLNAQSINNKNWKTYFDAPISDTAILNLHADSSFITDSKGEIKVRHHSNITGDTLIIEDFKTDQQGCPGIRGSYRINFIGDSFTLTVINDPCDGRSHALAGRKWTEVKDVSNRRP